MKLKFSTPFLFLALSFLLWESTSAAAAAACNQTCGGRTVPFPFGFSSTCHIQLNCTSNATVVAADFPVLSITADTLLVSLPAACNRPVEALRRLFTRNFAPNFLNAVLLQNCSGRRNPCFIPTTAVTANFELLDCGPKTDNISCYSETDNRTLFMDYEKIRRSGCRSLFSAISVESLDVSPSVSLEVRIVRLGWWVVGDCDCSKHAKCVGVSPPPEGKTPAYRCRCDEGFAGDGFRQGVGCRRESPQCNLSKYISGQCRGDTRILILLGGTAAAFTLPVTVAVIFYFIRKRLKSRNTRSRSQKLTKATDITIPIYPYKEIEKATNFFSEKKKLGSGAYGTVYSGKLSDNKWVAIKRITQRYSDTTNFSLIINEINLLSSATHPNLIKLLGCSIEKEHILVYEFMPNGTLCEHLRGQKGGALAWPVRLNIALETSKALAYLHNALNIYHRDVKSSNILLDYNYCSKVADFGLSRLGLSGQSHVSTAPQGTPGYVDPQYHQDFHLSDKSDVYSFGVVLFEIITGLRAVDLGRPPSQMNLAAMAVDRIGRGCLQEIIDPFILTMSEDWILSSVNKVGELAFRCLAFDRELRPSMAEVVVELERIVTRKWMNFESSSSSNLSMKAT